VCAWDPNDSPWARAASAARAHRSGQDVGATATRAQTPTPTPTRTQTRRCP
jgi:hypothetical protein